MFYDFMQVLNSIKEHYTNNEYLYRHILFTMIYSLQEQKLNHRNYSKQEIIMSNFIQAKEYDMIMYEHAFIFVINFFSINIFRIVYNASMHKIGFGQSYCKDLHKRIL
jgi:hypothetical protein